MRRKQNSSTRRRRKLTVTLVILMLLALGFVTVWKGFVVKKVVVEGNEVYSDEQIEKWVLNDEYSWNSLYVLVKNRLRKTDEIPFVDSMEITLDSPQELRIKVKEKGVLGYIYIPSLGQNAYFDKDGFVVELSQDVLDGVMKISGLQVEEPKLYEKLKMENTGILQTLLTVSQLLQKYDRIPGLLAVQDGEVLLVYDRIQVNLGEGDYLNEKIVRMHQLLPELGKKKGTLHLETWTRNSTNVYFRKNEQTKIPDDVQVPAQKTEDGAEKPKEE